MPQLIGAGLAYATGAAASGATVAAAAATTAFTVAGVAVTYGAIGSAIVVAGTVAYSSSQNAKLRRSLSTSMIDNGRSVMVRDPIAPRRLIYGTARVSGTIVFAHTTGTKNEYLHLVVVLAGHEVQDIGEIYFNDEIVPFSGANATGKYAGNVRINRHLGSSTQTADSDLVSEIPSLWTSNHRLRGCAYLAIRLKWSPDLFPNGLPVVSAIVRGKKVYDPRTATTVWSDNAALCAADYLTDSTFGKGIDYARLDEDALIEAANICDETVVLGVSLSKTCDVASGNRHIGCASTSDIVPGMRVAGTGIPSGAVVAVPPDPSGTFFTIDRDPIASNTGITLTVGAGENRYTCNGIITADQDPEDVLRDLAGAMAGHVVDTGGVWHVRAGAARSSVLTLTDDDVCGGFSVQPRQSRQDSFNGVKGVYVSPANQWSPADFPAVKNDTYMADDGGVRLWLDAQYNFTTSPATAQRLAKIELERGRQQITVQAMYKLKAMKLMPGDVVSITRSRFGWTSKLFEVIDWELQIYGGEDNPSIGVLLSLRETAASVWDWADGEETDVDLAPNTSLPNPFVVPTPSPTFLSDSTTVIIQPDGTVMPRIKVSWTTPNNTYVESGGMVEIEYKQAADSDWLTWSAVKGDLLQDYISADLKVGIAYNVRLRFRNALGVRGSYATSGSITAVGDTGSPLAPSSLSAVAKPGYNLIDWEPSASATVNEYLIYRSIVSAVSGFALLASTAASQYSDGDVTPGDSYWYKVVAQSAAGYPSADLGPSGEVVALASSAAAVPSDPTAPADQSVSGVYGSSDGTVMAYRTVRVYPLPANAVWQNLLIRRNGASEWLVAGQFENTGNVDVRIDDLTPGVTYDIAVQAWSGAGGSNVIAGSSITAPNKTANADTPGTITYTSGNNSAFTEPPQFGAFGVRYGLKVEWAIPSGKDVYVWQWVTTTTDSDAAADAAANPIGPGLQPNYVATPKVVLWVDGMLGNAYFRVRAVNRSGIASAWAGGSTNINALYQRPSYVGDAGGKNVGTTSGTVAAGDDSRITGAAQKSSNLSDLASASSARSNLGLGSIATQNTNAVSVTGITTGSGGSQLKVLVRQPIYGTISVTGGSASETVNLSLSGYGFSTRPDALWLQSADWDRLLIRYDIDDSSSGTAVLRLTMADGSNLPTLASLEVTGEALEYD